MKKFNPWRNTYIRAINFPRWKRDLLEAVNLRVKFYDDATVVDGVVRWKSNNSVPPSDILEFWNYSCLPFDFEKSEATRQAEAAAFLAEYRERMKNHVPSGEEMYEMRAAFGPGETVVNVITGQCYRT